MIGPADTRAAGLRPGRPPNQIELDLERRSTRSIVVLGSGGHGRELADIVRDVQAHDAEVSLLGVVDDACPDLGVLARSGIRFLGDSSALEDRACELFIGVGAPAIRSQIAESFADPFGPLIHPTAIVGSGSRIGRGSVLAQRSIVTTNVVIGRHTHVNLAASISHDCSLGDFVTICPGVQITGSVDIGDRVFIGAGATVLPGVRICDDAVVGAGAVVTRDVRRAQTVAGVPAVET